MPSPDIRKYVDLTVNDKSPQDIFDAAVTTLATNLPTWIPREGNTEVLLLEALAMEAAESTYAINRLPSGVVEALFKLFGIQRDVGNPPVVTLRFNMIGTTGYTIAAGAAVRMALPGGLQDVVFTTDSELNITPGVDTATVDATGDRFTSEANNVTLGTVLEFLENIIYVETVELEAIVTPGDEPETEQEYFTRAIARFGRLSDALVLPDHFVSATLEDPTFYRAFAIDNWDSVSGTPGSDGGHITIAVYGDGAPNSTGEKNALQLRLDADAVANLQVHVVDPTVTTVAVTSTVKAFPGQVTATVQARVAAAITDYLDPMKWNWGGTVRRNELIALISNVEGVDYVASLAAPATDVSLTGNAPLADAGTITTNVT